MRRRPRVIRLSVLGAIGLLAVLAVLAVIQASVRGPAVHTVALDAHPGDLIVDPASRHAFISTYTTDPLTHAMDPQTHLSMLDLHTGALMRTIDVGFDPQSTVVDGRTGHLFVAGFNQVLVIDTHTGQDVTTVALEPGIGGIAVDSRRQRLYVGRSSSSSSAGALTVLDTWSGTVLHDVTLDTTQNDLDSVNVGEPTIDERTGHVFLPITTSTYGTTAMTDSIAVLDTAGRLLHTTIIGRFAGQGRAALSLAVDATRGRVVVLDENTASVNILDVQTGRLVHRLTLGSGNTWSSGVYTAAFGSWGLDDRTGRLFLTTLRRVVCSSALSCAATGPPGRLDLLDTQSGRILRRLLPGLDPSQVIVDAQAGCVLVETATPDGRAETVRVLDAGTGAVRLRLTLGPGGSVLVDSRTGRVYLEDGKGTIARLDTRTGRFSSAVTLTEAAMSGQGYVSTSIVDGHVIIVHDNAKPVSQSDPLGGLPEWLQSWLPWWPRHARVVFGSVSTADAPR